jgi:hypothetical protein
VIKQPIIINACYCVHLRQHGIFFREFHIQISNSSSLKSIIFRLLTCTYRTNKFYIYWWQFFINLSEMWTWDWIGTLACAGLFSTDIFWILNYRNQREKNLISTLVLKGLILYLLSGESETTIFFKWAEAVNKYYSMWSFL